MTSLLIRNVVHNQKQTDVLIENNTFSRIAPNLNTRTDNVIDGSGKAILPGFYNTHSHAGMSIFRGISDDKELFSWLHDDIWPREARLTSDIIYHATKFSILEMIKTGTVFFADMYFEPQVILKAAAEMGIRVAASHSALDLFDCARCEQEKRKTDAYLNCPHPCPEITAKVLTIHAVYSASPELIRYTTETARKNNMYLHIHACETQKEVDDCLSQNGCTPIEYLDRLGALNEKTILAHAIFLNDRDIELLSRKKVRLCTNPVSNYKLASGVFQFQKLLEKGCIITLGTDSMASNNNLSMLEEMKICALSAKIQSMNPTAGAAEEVFKIATRNGAEAFGLNAGIIAEGKLADCILVDLNNHFLVPNYNLISNMVYSADSSCIDTVICNGKILMQNHHILGEEEITAKIKELSEMFRN